MKSTLLVFDIDGTLLRTRAGRWAFNRAFQRVYGLADAAATVPMAGRTDPMIHAEVCRQYGLDHSTFGLWKLTFLEELVASLESEPGMTLPGVRALLDTLSQDPAYTLALGTGNVEEGARLKLAAHDLNGYFHTGGFGADGATRDDVIARAIGRSEARRGAPFRRTVVIGDTPLDIQAGKANGCFTVGVATGYHTIDQLSATGADLVIPNFVDTVSVLSQIRTICIEKPVPGET